MSQLTDQLAKTAKLFHLQRTKKHTPRRSTILHKVTPQVLTHLYPHNKVHTQQMPPVCPIALPDAQCNPPSDQEGGRAPAKVKWARTDPKTASVAL
jgi:hypothetical protein